MFLRCLAAFCLSVFGVCGAERPVPEEIKAGFEMNAKTAADLERKLDGGKKGKPGEWVRMLAWYSKQMNSPQAAEIREKRILLIVSLISNTGVDFRFSQLGCLAEVHRTGDKFASRTGYDLVKVVWLQKEEQFPRSVAVLVPAVEFLFPEEPGFAINHGGSGAIGATMSEMMAKVVLGIGRRRYDDCEPLAIDGSGHDSPLGRSILDAVGKVQDPYFALTFGNSLRRLGESIEKGGGKVGWDFRALAQSLVERAAKQLPEEVVCTSTASRPEINRTIAEASGILKAEPAKAIEQQRAAYPPAARRYGAQPTVMFDVVIGCSGKVIWAGYVAGPVDLVGAASDAIKQWRYDPTKLNGYPVEGQTRVEVNFR